jgi:hypothetical protein
MIIFDQITEANRIEYLENLLKVAQTTLESVTKQRDRFQCQREFFQSALIEHVDVLSKVIEQRDRLAEAIRKHRDELELTSGDSVDRILWHVLDAVEGGSDDN